MQTVTVQHGTLTSLLSARATFYSPDQEDEEGFIDPNPVPYLSDIPCMPATGRNTRQDGTVFVALAGSLSFETKWSAIDLTAATRNRITEDDRVQIVQRSRDGSIISDGTYIVSGITEFDVPELGFAYAILNLKDEK